MRSGTTFIRLQELTNSGGGCRLITVLAVYLLLQGPGNLMSVACAQQSENDWLIYLGNRSAPQAPRKSMSAAEALPPLPLPATPLRRTERKKPPQPDYLMGKVIWGQAASYTDSSGQKMDIADWNLCPSDLEKLMRSARALNLSYHWTNTNLNDFHFDPTRLPALCISGVRTLRLDPTHLQALRQYVLDGGMVICDSIAGSPFFYDACKEIFAEAFPESRFRVLPADHPLYHIFTDIEPAEEPGTAPEKGALLEAIYVGSRAAVLVSKHGLGCGWNRDLTQVQGLERASIYDIDRANELGVNLAAYIVGYAEAGRIEGKPELFGLADKKIPSDEFVFAQIKHEGAWNVHPGAAGALLMKLRRHTSVRVNLNRMAIDLGQDDLTSYPFLYLTGLDDFSFSTQQRAALQQYLSLGGFLLINNGLGLSTFDRAVRREMEGVLPGQGFQTIPRNHDLFRSLFSMEQVQYTPMLESEGAQGDSTLSSLLGMRVDGELRVLYSPYDVEAGWLGAYYPMMRGYQPPSAQQLGMNVITYVLTN